MDPPALLRWLSAAEITVCLLPTPLAEVAIQDGEATGVWPRKLRVLYTGGDKLHRGPREGATFNEGSWWPRWDTWLSSQSGKMIPAREPGDSDHPPLEDAPGSYVKTPATR